MSDQIAKMTDEEIIKWQEELYELEKSAMTGPPMTESEKMELIRDFLAPNFAERLKAKVEARKKQLVQELAATSDPQKKACLQRNLMLLSDS